MARLEQLGQFASRVGAVAHAGNRLRGRHDIDSASLYMYVYACQRIRWVDSSLLGRSPKTLGHDTGLAQQCRAQLVGI